MAVQFNPYVCMMTNSTCYKNTKKMTVKGVLWHSTGANNTWLKRYVQPLVTDKNYEDTIKKLGKNRYNNDWNHIEKQAGLNCWVGKFADGTVGTVQTMPWDYRPWGCGTRYKNGYSCNDGWIQFEICEDNLKDKDYAQKVWDEAVRLTAWLCEKFGLDPNGTVEFHGKKVPVILDHKTSWELGFGSGHGDIRHWFPKILNKDMADARREVAALMGGVDPKPEPEPEPKPKPEPTPKSLDGYTVGKTYTVRARAGLNVRESATTSSKRVKTLAYGTKVLCIDLTRDKSGNTWMKIADGWIAAKYRGDTYVS